MGKIYTGYFAGIRNYPSGVLIIGITRFKPEYFKGINLESLAPSANLLRQYKNKEIDNFIFKQKYIQEIEDRGFVAKSVRQILEEIAGNRDIILCCYEKPSEFCHRHILAEWLGGVEEYKI